MSSLPRSVSPWVPCCLTACDTDIGCVLPVVVAHATQYCSHRSASIRMCGTILLFDLLSAAGILQTCGIMQMLMDEFSWSDTLGMHGRMRAYASTCRSVQICTFPCDTRPLGGIFVHSFSDSIRSSWLLSTHHRCPYAVAIVCPSSSHKIFETYPNFCLSSNGMSLLRRSPSSTHEILIACHAMHCRREPTISHQPDRRML